MSMPAEVQLKLHIAVTSGVVCNVILGDLENRLDYVLNGECLSSLGDLLNEASAGEAAVDRSSWESFMSSKQEFNKSVPLMTRSTATSVIIDQRAANIILDNTIEGPVYIPGSTSMYFSDRWGSLNYSSRRMSSTIEDDGKISLKRDSFMVAVPDEFIDLLSKFVNASIVQSYGLSAERRRSENFSKVNGPLQKGEQGSSYTFSSFSSQYRSISIIFVKLLTRFDPTLAQKAMTIFLEGLRQNGGVFQQYAECKFAISVTSGTILFAKLGNLIRSEASLLGIILH
ncbi:hypothetical protein HDU67_010198 [Dinochytrium kinnereticum]|nr:hypothetical protein HDU67_010198 [Dinochytrium kinnereticum]